jgi:hypothetical protein
MNQKEINSINMIDGTVVYLNKSTTEWNNEAAIVESVDYILERKKKIDAEVKDILQKQTVGITDQLYAGLGKAIDLAYIMAKRIKVYARKTGNLMLVRDVDYAKTEMDDGTFKAIIDRLWLVAKRGEEHLTDLAAYKVKPTDVADLNTAIDSIKDKPAMRKSMTGENVESTASIKLMLKEILDKINDELDDEIEALCENEEFVEGYFAVRRTYDIKARGKAEKKVV